MNLDIDLDVARVYEFKDEIDKNMEINLMTIQYGKEIKFLKVDQGFELSFHWGIIVHFS